VAAVAAAGLGSEDIRRLLSEVGQVATYQQQISIITSGHGDMHDLTEQVLAAVVASAIQTGLVNVFNVGSTAAVGAIEFEPGLLHDLPAVLDKLIPPAANTGMNRHGTTGMGTRICKRRCSDHH
jgi:thiamine phosphate synthase YjbQ (UPF0047 family)